MSRPFRFVFPVAFLAGALGFTGCVGTVYDDTYSYKKNYFKPPEDKSEASASTILGVLDKKAPAGGADAAVPGGPPPAGEVPGLPAPAGLPDAGGVPAPAAPAAPAPAAPPPNN